MNQHKDQFQKKMKETYYGEIPLFFSNLEIRDKSLASFKTRSYRRKIKVDDYNTDAYLAQGYHKAISRIL